LDKSIIDLSFYLLQNCNIRIIKKWYNKTCGDNMEKILVIEDDDAI